MDKCLRCGTRGSTDQEYCLVCGAPVARTPRTMDEAWQAYGLRKNLGGSGVWSIFWGVMVILGGAALLDQGGFNVVLIGLGLFLIGTGIAAWAAPGPVTLRLDALSLILVGLWNAGSTLLAWDSSQMLWLGLGIVQMIWGGQRFLKSGDFTRVKHVPKAFANEVGELVMRTQRANAARENDVVEFRAGSKLWKARLLRGVVVAVSGTGLAAEVRFGLPADFELQATGEAQGRGWPPGEVRLGDTRWTGTVSPAAAGRCADWRATLPGLPGAGLASAVDAQEPGAAPGSPGAGLASSVDAQEPGRSPAVPGGGAALGSPGSSLASSLGAQEPGQRPAVPGRGGAAKRSGMSGRARLLIGAGVAAVVVVCVVGALIGYRVLGRQAFERGEAAYQAGDPQEAFAALDRAVQSANLLGAPYAEQAAAHRRECVPLIEADKQREQQAYGKAADGYQVYLARYPAGAFVAYAQAGIETAYDEWAGSLIAGANYRQAIDVLGLAYAAYEGRPVPAALQSAYETALYGLAEDTGEDGQALIAASWEAICAGEGATSQAVGLLTGEPARAWYQGSQLTLPAKAVATEPGHFRYAVCLEEEPEKVESCSYMPAGVVNRLQMNWRVVVRDTLTGQPAGSTVFEGGVPEQCPAAWTFTQGSLTGSLRGDRPGAGAVLNWVMAIVDGEPAAAVAIVIQPPEPPAEPLAEGAAEPTAQVRVQATAQVQAEPTAQARVEATATPKAAPAEQVEFDIWHNRSGENAAALYRLLDDYRAQHPEVHVNAIEVRDLAQIDVGLAAGAVDIVLWSTANLAQWAEQQAIVPLTGYADANWIREEHIDPAASAVIVEDQVYGLPMDAMTLALIYNRALLDDADVPQTTEALLAQAGAWSKSAYFFAYPAQLAYFSACWFHGGQAYWADGACAPNLDVPDGVAAAELMAAFSAIMPPMVDYGAVTELFHAGELPLTLNGAWALPVIAQMGIDYGVAPLPVLSATGNKPAPYVETTAWMVTQRAAAQELTDEAWALISFMASAESQQAMMQAGQVPTARAAGQAGWFGDREDLAVFFAQAKLGTTAPPASCMTQVLPIVEQTILDLWSGMDPAEAVTTAQSVLEAAAGE